jgi:hypothetical protein
MIASAEDATSIAASSSSLWSSGAGSISLGALTSKAGIT